MHRFYCPDVAITNTLGEAESHHCARVLRLAEGDTIEVADGNGTLYTARITLAHQKHTRLEINGKQLCPTHWRHRIHLLVAPTKNLDRIEWLAEKATEIGFDRLTPLLCRNSERTALKNERIEKILVAAMKQSLKATLPLLDPLTPLRDALDEPFNGKRLIAYCDPMLPRRQRQLLPQAYTAPTDVQILIGPEGDFAPDEVDAALNAGFTPVSLGDSRLRTETAALAALAAVHTIDLLHTAHNNTI